jgi:hypothetical protein
VDRRTTEPFRQQLLRVKFGLFAKIDDEGVGAAMSSGGVSAGFSKAQPLIGYYDSDDPEAHAAGKKAFLPASRTP